MLNIAFPPPSAARPSNAKPASVHGALSDLAVSLGVLERLALRSPLDPRMAEEYHDAVERLTRVGVWIQQMSSDSAT